MEFLESLRWLFTPVGIGTLLGVALAFMLCSFLPPSSDCSILGGISIATGFIGGLIAWYALLQRRK